MYDILNAKNEAATVHPVWLWIDPTNRCNLACTLCYTKFSHGRQDMDPARLEDVLSRMVAAPSIEVKGIHLNWRGEPLMHPRFAQLLEIT